MHKPRWRCDKKWSQQTDPDIGWHTALTRGVLGAGVALAAGVAGVAGATLAALTTVTADAGGQITHAGGNVADARGVLHAHQFHKCQMTLGVGLKRLSVLCGAEKPMHGTGHCKDQAAIFGEKGRFSTS